MLEWVPFRGLFAWVDKVTEIGGERLKKRGAETDRRRRDTRNRVSTVVSNHDGRPRTHRSR
ncbi:hypothetical protein ABZ621_31340 [Streptomyces sp. NPDC007863]|uniref:hypothetical protein n=1 Tax=Streptomyces sp. NPDC007863 TaxID=3154894 RepID=UPI0034051E84